MGDTVKPFTKAATNTEFYLPVLCQTNDDGELIHIARIHDDMGIYIDGWAKEELPKYFWMV